MKHPPAEIDGAKVLEWAWSGEKPFGIITRGSSDPPIEIYGLAICQYATSENIYRFSCNENWEAEQDSSYISITEAKENIPYQYKKVEKILVKL